MSGHTPGPWVAELSPRDSTYRIFHDRGTYRAELVRLVQLDRDNDENEANARLIAAAPDTYEELKRSTAILILLLDEIRGTPLARLSEPVRQRIEANRDAIAKAEGK